LTQGPQASVLGQAIDEIGLTVDPNNMKAIAIKIDDYLALGPERGRLMEMALFKIVQNEFGIRAQPYEGIIVSDGTIGLLVNVSDSADRELHVLLTGIREATQAEMAQSITIGIGSDAKTIGEIGISFENALDMVNQRFTEGYGQTFIYDSAASHREYICTCPAELEEEIVNAIRLCRFDQFRSGLERLSHSICANTYNNAMLAFLQVSITCIKTFKTIVGENDRTFSIDFRALGKRMNELETIQQGIEWLEEIFGRYEKILEQIKSQKNYKRYVRMTEEVMQMVQARYSDYELSVESIADKYGYTPSYFAQIFKTHCGMNLNDYIRKVRIEKAKELLRASELTVTEIAVSTGYPNTNYFYHAFKTEVGITPASYREQNRRNNAGVNN
jgi:two-component system response regulator YesN